MTIDEKKEKYLSLAHKYFPELYYSQISSFYSGDRPSSGRITLGGQAQAFADKFGYPKSILHYTSLDSFLNIINSREVRMYNCNHLNDSEEISHAYNALNLSIDSEEIQKQKRNFFTFSGSEYDPQNPTEDFNLWRLYGGSGAGIGIVFEIINSHEEWKNIICGKVQYGTESKVKEDMINFIKAHFEFNQTHKLFENIPTIIPAIAMHIKENIWSIENESRIFAYCPYNEDSLQSEHNMSGNPYLSGKIQHSLSKGNKPIAYTSLPLDILREEKRISQLLPPEYSPNILLNTIPHLRIKKVIIGHKIDEETFCHIIKILHNQDSSNPFKESSIEYSKFKKFE